MSLFNVIKRLLVVVAIVISPAVLAIDDTAGSGLTFSLSGSDAIVDGCIGACPLAITIPDTVTDGGGTALTYTVTRIGNAAFDSAGLASVTFTGSNLQTIGFAAFSNNFLSSVSLPAGLVSIGMDVFFDNPFLTSVTLPTSLTTIGFGAFEATMLTNVTIPENVTTIDDRAFVNLALTSVAFLGDRPAIGLTAFAVNPGLSTVSYQCGTTGWPGAAIPGTAITPTLAVGSCSATAVPVLPLPLLALLAALLALVGARRIKG